MSTSFNLNKTSIITRALQTINVIDLNSTGTPEERSYASDILNLMIKKWEAQGMNLWKRTQGYLFPALEQNNYQLGNAGDNCTNSYNFTTITATSSGTSLTVDSIIGVSDGDYIGIQLDDGTRQWTTVKGTPSNFTITIDAALTDTADATNTVVSYTTKVSRPLRILRATTIDLTSVNLAESTMGSLGYDEYFDLPIKNSPGRPNQFFYDKLLGGTTPYTGTLYLFPQPNSVNDVIAFTYQESLADINNNTDYADFPQEWGYALIFNLACELAYHYGKFQELQIIQPKADAELAVVQQFDSDDSPIRFTLGRDNGSI